MDVNHIYSSLVQILPVSVQWCPIFWRRRSVILAPFGSKISISKSHKAAVMFSRQTFIYAPQVASFRVECPQDRFEAVHEIEAEVSWKEESSELAFECVMLWKVLPELFPSKHVVVEAFSELKKSFNWHWILWQSETNLLLDLAAWPCWWPFRLLMGLGQKLLAKWFERLQKKKAFQHQKYSQARPKANAEGHILVAI